MEALGRRKDVHIAAEAMRPVSRLKEIPRARWREVVMERVDERLKLLRTDYIDVYNVHTPEGDYSRDRFEAVIGVQQEMKDQGKIGAIGAACHQPSFLPGNLLGKKRWSTPAPISEAMHRGPY